MDRLASYLTTLSLMGRIGALLFTIGTRRRMTATNGGRNALKRRLNIPMFIVLIIPRDLLVLGKLWRTLHTDRRDSPHLFPLRVAKRQKVMDLSLAKSLRVCTLTNTLLDKRLDYTLITQSRCLLNWSKSMRRIARAWNPTFNVRQKFLPLVRMMKIAHGLEMDHTFRLAMHHPPSIVKIWIRITFVLVRSMIPLIAFRMIGKK